MTPSCWDGRLLATILSLSLSLSLSLALSLKPRAPDTPPEMLPLVNN